jgi:RND family efflux transporter MFP subunit
MWIAGSFLALAVIGGAFYFGYQDNIKKTAASVQAPQTTAVERGDVIFTVTGPGISVDNGETALESQVNGKLESLNVYPGDRISSGQVLATLGPRADFENVVNAARANVLEAQATLDATTPAKLLAQAKLNQILALQEYQKANNQRLNPNYIRGSQSAIEAATAEYYLAENAFKEAQHAYEKVSDFPVDDDSRNVALNILASARKRFNIATLNLNYLQGKPTADEVAASNAKADVAKAVLEEANHALELAQNNQSPELLQAKANLNSAQAAFAKAQANLDHLVVKAPFDGVVLTVSGQIGQNMTEGALLMTLSNSKGLGVQVTVVEEDFNLIHIGQPVELFFDAIPDMTISGKISRIVPERIQGDQALYPVYISLDKIPDTLVQGMTVDASITIDKKTNVLRLPRTAVRSVGGNKAEVEIWTGEAIEKKTIQLGLSGDSYVEVLSGLDVGDLVVVQ